MLGYIVRRLLLFVPSLVILSIFVFAAIRALPGDPIDDQLATAGVVPEDRVKIKDSMGLNDPIYTQYANWVTGALQGDLGKPFFSSTGVSDLILEALPVTLELALMSIFMALLVGIPAGALSALKQGGPADYALRTFAFAGLAVPTFWIGTIVLLLPAVWWSWTPPLQYVAFEDDPLRNLYEFSIPSAVLALHLTGIIMRMARSEVLEVIQSDYVRTARAKGLRDRTVLLTHVLKNALIPILTIAGVSLATLLGGSVIVESIFNLPGLGRLMLDSITARDLVIVQSLVIVIGFAVLVVNLLVDLAYGFLDPRVRLGQSS
jgi:peptide/nickel transport system permease protein